MALLQLATSQRRMLSPFRECISLVVTMYKYLLGCYLTWLSPSTECLSHFGMQSLSCAVRRCPIALRITAEKRYGTTISMAARRGLTLSCTI